MTTATSTASTYYAIKCRNSELIELRQTRFRKQFQKGVEHPHDLCGIARSVTELKEMVSEALKGASVDYSAVEQQPAS